MPVRHVHRSHSGGEGASQLWLAAGCGAADAAAHCHTHWLRAAVVHGVRAIVHHDGAVAVGHRHGAHALVHVLTSQLAELWGQELRPLGKDVAASTCRRSDDCCVEPSGGLRSHYSTERPLPLGVGVLALTFPPSLLLGARTLHLGGG